MRINVNFCLNFVRTHNDIPHCTERILVKIKFESRPVLMSKHHDSLLFMALYMEALDRLCVHLNMYLVLSIFRLSNRTPKMNITEVNVAVLYGVVRSRHITPVQLSTLPPRDKTTWLSTHCIVTF